MGIVLPQTVKVRVAGGKNKYYENKGYGNGKKIKTGDIIEVNVLDLPKSSGIKVKVICDFCGKETYVHYGCVSEDPYITTCRDKACTNAKIRYTSILKYGCINPGCSKQAKEKREKTMIDRYGVPNAYCNGGQIKENIKKNNIEKFGVDNPFKSQEIQDKIKKHNLETIGVEHPCQSQEFQDNVKKILLERYGEDSAFKIPQFRQKILESFQFKGTGPCSRAQKYINLLTGGILNKRIDKFLADICFEKEKLVIEYDGGGHYYSVKTKQLTQKEFDIIEKEREEKINKKGYKIIRIIATKDRIPSDEVILNLVNGFKNSNFKIVRIDLEEGTIDRDYNEKWNCKFGKLKRIGKKDLENLEKKYTSQTIE